VELGHGVVESLDAKEPGDEIVGMLGREPSYATTDGMPPAARSNSMKRACAAWSPSDNFIACSAASAAISQSTPLVRFAAGPRIDRLALRQVRRCSSVSP
jgi:hypothetical protein